MTKYQKSGIYKIRHIDSGKVYVGSSVYITQRWAQHRKLLSIGKHHSPHLQNAWSKHGEMAFEFVIIEECSRDQFIVREQYWMDFLGGHYNYAKVAGSRLGVPVSAATRAKISVASKGHTLTAEVRAKLSANAKAQGFGAAWKGVIRPESTRLKMSAAMKGKQHCLGRAWTDEMKAKSSATQSGRPLAGDHKDALRAAWVMRSERDAGKPWAPAEAGRAKTHCPQGHDYTPENTILRKNTLGGVSRGCRECSRQRVRDRRAKLKQAA